MATNKPTESNNPSPAAKSPQDVVSGWLGELAKAEKREKGWRKTAESAVKLYEADAEEGTPYNILYSNTETLSPALYNTVPRPQVRTRFKSEDALAIAASRVGQKLLEFLLDTGNPEYPTFDEQMKGVVLSALVPGRGLARYRYDAAIEEAAEPAEGEQPLPPKVSDEIICGEDIPWNMMLHGYGRSWKQVPWIAYQHNMTKEELEDNFQTLGAKVPLGDASEDSSGTSSDIVQRNRDKQSSGVKLACVWEIWDKQTKKVIFVAPGFKDSPLKTVDDPLELQGFFPSPRPLRLFATLSGLTPVTLYKLYKSQAEELNTVSRRIQSIVKALKVRGFYSTDIADLKKLLESEDNTMLPAENMSALFGQGQTASDAVWMLPLTDLVAALQQLYTQREQIKTIIFELTGMADIMRGSSQASETLGAQQLKNQWGTLRLKRMQKEVAGYCCDSLRLMLEMAVSKLSQDTIKKMTGMPFPTQEEKATAQQQAQVLQQQAAAQPQQVPPPQPGQPPQPPAAPQLPPGIAQIIGAPTWEEILSLLKDDLQRNFRIDIETNSTVDAEATEDKEDITELLTALSQFLTGIGPLIENGTMPFKAAQAILITVVRKYRMGDEVEDAFKEMKEPPPPQDPNMGKQQLMQMQGELAQKKSEADQKQADQKFQLEMAALQATMSQAKGMADLEKQVKEMELMFRSEEHKMKMQELRQKGALSTAQHQQQLQLAMMPPQPPAAARSGVRS
jgi:hypothetical protein